MTTSQARASSRVPTSQPSSPASAPAASGSGSKQTPGPYSAAARQRAAQAPCRPQPMIPALRASSRASSWAATAATAPVRRAVIARTSTSASGRPSSAEDTQIIPITTGNPAAGLRGNEVTHLRMARPAPCGRASRGSLHPGERRGRPSAASATRPRRTPRSPRARGRWPPRGRSRRAPRRGRRPGSRAPATTLPAPVARNGKQHPGRPRIEVRQSASPRRPPPSPPPSSSSCATRRRHPPRPDRERTRGCAPGSSRGRAGRPRGLRPGAIACSGAALGDRARSGA